MRNTLILLLVLVCGCYPAQPLDPGPSYAGLESEAELAIRVYADRLAEVHSDVAEGIMDGTLSTDKDIVDFVQDKTKEAREDAFSGLKKPIGDAGGLNNIDVNLKLETGYRRAAKK